ncbi:MAG TPA: ECF-type sigma factor [Candidatus Angelobacter sp.]
MERKKLSRFQELSHQALVSARERKIFLMAKCGEDPQLNRETEMLLEKIDLLFERSLAFPRDEREAFLTKECENDEFIYGEVKFLLNEREKLESAPDQVVNVLLRLNQGDKSALDSLTPLVYTDLRRLASYLLRSERPNHTLRPTALVNEVYLKFTRQLNLKWQSKAHFIALAARAMRQVLIDYADHRNRQKGPGKYVVLALEEALNVAEKQSVDLVALNESLDRLMEAYPRKAQAIELRIFGGLTNDEIAEVLQIAPNTVIEDCKFAAAWLHQDMASRKKDRKKSNGE